MSPLDDGPEPAVDHEPIRHLELSAMLRRWRELRDGAGGEILGEERLEELWRAPPRPYPGLRSFAADESNIFFARDRETDQLIEKLGRSSVVVVLGGSGSGKSSLVRAGLIPRLAGGAQVPGRPGGWYTVEMSPGEDPNAGLIRGLCKGLLDPVLGPQADMERGLPAACALLGCTEGDAATLREQGPTLLRELLFDQAAGGTAQSAILDPQALFSLALDGLDRFDQALREGLRVGRPNLLILLDQFEEAFRPGVDPQGQRNLCELLAATAERQPPGLFIAVTMRSEEAHRATDAGLAEVLNQSSFQVGPLHREADRDSIVFCPARAVLGDWVPGWREAASSSVAPFSEAVVRALTLESQRLLLKRLHGSDHLPLLQHALLRMWDAAAERWDREARDGEVDLEIGEADLHEACGKGDALLTDCLELHAGIAFQAACHAALGELAKRANAPRRVEALAFTALCTLARRDDRNNWARRFTSAARVAQLAAAADGLADAAECRAAVEFLATLHRHGYLNRRPPPPGGNEEAALYDVSHEALIRCWSRLRDDVLPRAEKVAADLHDVDRNIEAEALGAMHPADANEDVARRATPLWLVGRLRRLMPGSAVPGRVLAWLTHVAEQRATALVPARLRGSLDEVLGPNATVPRPLAAKMVEEEARRQGTMRQENDRASPVMGAEQLKRMEAPWRLASEYASRWISRPALVMALAFVVLAAATGAAFSYRSLNEGNEDKAQQFEIERNAAYITHLAVDVRGEANRGLPLGIAAGEVLAAYQWLNELLGKVNERRGKLGGQPRDSTGRWIGDLPFINASRQVNVAERELLTRVSFRSRRGGIEELQRGGAACAHVDGDTSTAPELMREVAGWRLGLQWDGAAHAFVPAAGRAGDATLQVAYDPDLLANNLRPRNQAGPDLGAVCVSADASFLMSWATPTGITPDAMPRFFDLRWYCAESGQGTCQRWGVRALWLGQLAVDDVNWTDPVTFSRDYGSVRDGTRSGQGVFLLPDEDRRQREGFIVLPGTAVTPVVVDIGRRMTGMAITAATPGASFVDVTCPEASVNGTTPRCELSGLRDWRIFLTRLNPDQANAGDGEHFRFFLDIANNFGHPLVTEAEFHAGRIVAMARDGQRLLLRDHHGIWRGINVEGQKPAARLAPLGPRRADPGSSDPRVREQTPACRDYNCIRPLPKGAPG